MSTIGDGGISGVLAQIRALRTEATGSSPAPAATGAAGGLDFGKALTRVLDTVSKQQTEATSMAESFERGDKNTSLAQVMLSMQSAQVSFKAVSEVRNRLVQAYQDIQNMPI